jgi:hypothetical protein
VANCFLKAERKIYMDIKYRTILNNFEPKQARKERILKDTIQRAKLLPLETRIESKKSHFFGKSCFHLSAEENTLRVEEVAFSHLNSTYSLIRNNNNKRERRGRRGKMDF